MSRYEGGFEEFKQGAKVLDSTYIPTLYPNGIAGDLVLISIMKRRAQKNV